jgi:hypothetical protein
MEGGRDGGREEGREREREKARERWKEREFLALPILQYGNEIVDFMRFLFFDTPPKRVCLALPIRLHLPSVISLHARTRTRTRTHNMSSRPPVFSDTQYVCIEIMTTNMHIMYNTLFPRHLRG